MNEWRAGQSLSELTVLEVAELSRLLEEKWGRAIPTEDFSEDTVQAFVLAIERYAARTLGQPDDHLASVRSDLRRAVAAQMLSRDKLGAAARDLADHLQLVEHVKSLQTGQKEITAAMAVLGDRIRQIEADMQVLKAETKLEALKEAQSVVYAVKSGLNQQIQDLAIKVAVNERLSGPALPPA